MVSARCLFLRSVLFASLFILCAGSLLRAQWNRLPDFPVQTDAAFSFVIGETAYVSGGLTGAGLFAWDATTRTWANAGNLPSGQSRPWAFAFSYNGKGYMGGGGVNGGAVTDEFSEFDPATNRWTKRAPFAGGPRDGCFAFVLGNKGYVGAGFDGEFLRSDFWEYDFESDRWSSLGEFPGGALIFPSFFVVNGKGYVVGGGGQTESSALYEFNPASREWSRRADFPGAARQAGVCFALDGLGYYGGGMAGYTQTFQDFWTYNPALDRWTKLADQYPEQFAAWSVSFAVGDKGYVGTGATFSGQGIVLSNRFFSYPYDPPAPTALLSTTEIDFGQVTVGTSSSVDLMLSAATAAELEVQSVAFGSADASAKGLTLASDRAFPATLSGLSGATITVSFAPSASGEVDEVIIVRTNDPANPELTVTVSGSGLEALQPAAQFSAPELDFGDVIENEEKVLLLSISPANEAGLQVGSIAVSNPDKPQHGFSFSPSRPLPAELAFGETLDVTVRFSPVDTGSVVADLTVMTNAPGSSSATIPMSGRGLEGNVMSVDIAEGSNRFFSMTATPNPVVDVLTLSLELSERSAVMVRIIDMQGRDVFALSSSNLSPGRHSRTLDFSDLVPGGYVVEVRAGNRVQRVGVIKIR